MEIDHSGIEHESLHGFIEFRADITSDILKEKKQKQVAADTQYINQKNTILEVLPGFFSRLKKASPALSLNEIALYNL